MKYYTRAYKDLFKGRVSRKEFWMFVLFHFLFMFIAAFFDGIFGLEIVYSDYSPLMLVYVVISVLPSVSMQTKRLHDIGKSGWWILLGCLPLISIVYIIFLCLKTDMAINKYGPIPECLQPQINVAPIVTAPLQEELRPQSGTSHNSHKDHEVIASQVSSPIAPTICFCRKCGQKLLPDSDFCSYCGTEIRKEK